MIPLIVTGGPPKARPARGGEEDTAEPEAGFASLMQDAAKDDPAADPDALPLGVFLAPLPKVPEPGTKSQDGAATPCDPAEAGAAPVPVALIGTPETPDAAAPVSAQTALLPQDDTQTPSQALVLEQEAPKPRPRESQGLAEIAMRAALSSDDPSDTAIDAAIEVSVDPAAGPDDAQVQPAATPPLRQADPTPARATAPVALHPAEVVAQILPAAKAQDGAVELLLAPEELGKLRFVIQHEGGSVKISLAAERPETLDLLRRHADQLVQEFRQSGYSGATINFGTWSGQGRQGQTAQADRPEDPVMADAIPDIPALPALLAPALVGSAAQGLNLRL